MIPKPVIESQDLCGQIGDDLCDDVLAGQHGVLGFGGFQGGGSNRVRAAHIAACQPGGQPCPAAAADGVW
jgi:hypothetical protein